MARRVTAAEAPDAPAQRVTVELERLAGMDAVSLRRRWRMVFGRSAPEALPRAILIRALAYRIQALAFGDLEPETIRSLERLASGGAGEMIPLPQLRSTKRGTLLVREWGGVLQRVMVLEDGFVWNGQTYDSLSRVARAITGTNWNGPRFFGLREKERPEAKARSTSAAGAGP